MSDRILFKLPESGEYITLLELMRRYPQIVLEYKPNANQIQVRPVTDSFNGLLRVGKYLGNLKHDFGKTSSP